MVQTDDDRSATTVAKSAASETEVSLYHLNAFDNPGSLICYVNGENYSEWSVEMQNVLQAKHKLCFIDGSL